MPHVTNDATVQPGIGASASTRPLSPETGDDSPPPPQASNVSKPAGAYRIWAVDADGDLPAPKSGANKAADSSMDPSDKRAVEIYFSLVDFSTVPPREQMALQADIDKVLRVIQKLYPEGSDKRNGAFRIYYIRLFNLARVGLVGTDASPEVAQLELAKLTADLLDDEGGSVKNAYLRVLGKYAALYSLPFLLAYLLVCLLADRYQDTLELLHVDPRWVASFCLLWIGCFNGVWLSYGIRKTKIALADLIVGEEDRMLPQIRLLFAGSLSCTIGLMFALGFIDVQLGTLSLSDIIEVPTMAFLVGLLFGIGELALPASLGSRASTLTAAIK